MRGSQAVVRLEQPLTPALSPKGRGSSKLSPLPKGEREQQAQSSMIWLFVRVSFMRRYTTSDTAIIAVTYQ